MSERGSAATCAGVPAEDDLAALDPRARGRGQPANRRCAWSRRRARPPAPCSPGRAVARAYRAGRGYRASAGRWRVLIQHIEHAPTSPQPIWQARRNALPFAAGEGRRATVEGQIVQADVEHEAQAVADLFEDFGGDGQLLPRSGSRPRQAASAPPPQAVGGVNGHAPDLGDRLIADGDGPLPPGAVARRGRSGRAARS